jgi:hypothetical protein
VSPTDPSVIGALDENTKAWEGGTALRHIVRTEHRKLIGLAGPIAEMLGGVGPFKEPLTDLAVVGALRSRTYQLSESDAQMVGNCTREDVLACCTLVRELLPQIVSEANRYDINPRAFDN